MGATSTTRYKDVVITVSGSRAELGKPMKMIVKSDSFEILISSPP